MKPALLTAPNHKRGMDMWLCSRMAELFMRSRPSSSLLLAPRLVLALSFPTAVWEAWPWGTQWNCPFSLVAMEKFQGRVLIGGVRSWPVPRPEWQDAKVSSPLGTTWWDQREQSFQKKGRRC